MSVFSTCKYVALCGKRDFAGMTKLRLLLWEDYCGGQRNQNGSYQRRHEGQNQRGDVMKAEVGAMFLENGGKNHGIRNEGRHLKVKRQRYILS